MDKQKYHKNRNIVLHDYNSVYFPIPKVACTSLIKLCADVLKIPLKGENLEEEIHDMGFPSLSREELENKFNHYYKFAFVRNPWDRMVSLYENKMNNTKYESRLNSNFISHSEFKISMSFEEFTSVIGKISDKIANPHFKSQYLSLMEDPLKMDYIGKFESLSKDFETIRKNIDLPKINLSWLMKGKRTQKDYQTYYTEISKKIIKKRFEKDIDFFDYSF